MEKKRPSGSTDESAVVKAAAWAWYQHGSGSGSGSDGNPAREYDVARPRHVPRPSRYKLEAMRSSSKDKEGLLLLDHNLKTQSSNVSLLDDYEIQSISKHLDTLIDQYAVANQDGDDHKDNEDFRRKDAFSDDDKDNHNEVMEKNNKKKNNNLKKKINLRGFWIRHAAAMCGTREDVVGTTTKVFWDGRRQRMEEGRRVLPVVMAATCRPRGIIS